jgi:hypothetical protein
LTGQFLGGLTGNLTQEVIFEVPRACFDAFYLGLGAFWGYLPCGPFNTVPVFLVLVLQPDNPALQVVHVCPFGPGYDVVAILQGSIYQGCLYVAAVVDVAIAGVDPLVPGALAADMLQADGIDLVAIARGDLVPAVLGAHFFYLVTPGLLEGETNTLDPVCHVIHLPCFLLATF